MGWRYFAERLDGDGGSVPLADDIPLKDVGIDDVLSGDSGITGTISPEVARLKADGRPIFALDWATAIFAEADGEIRGGGILTGLSPSKSSLALEVTGFTGYLKDMPYVSGIHFENTDALDIARHIWTHVQNQPHGDLGLILDQQDSGVLIGSTMNQGDFDTENGPLVLEEGPYKLRWWQDFDLQSNFDGLAQDTPFDYHERHVWDGDEVKHYLDFGVPRIGARRHDLRFVYGENVFDTPNLDEDGYLYASESLVLGAGEGSSMRNATARRDTDGLRRVAVHSDTSLRSQSRVNSVARQVLAARKNITELSDIIVRNHPHAPIGAISIGDEIYLEGEVGWTRMEGWVRVLAINIQPDTAGDQQSLSVVATDRLAV